MASVVLVPPLNKSFSKTKMEAMGQGDDFNPNLCVVQANKDVCEYIVGTRKIVDWNQNIGGGGSESSLLTYMTGHMKHSPLSKALLT